MRAVIYPTPGRSLVLTIDVITPIVDDPRAFGAIAAANALSDVWAMGGRPEVALSFAGFPTDKLPLESLAEALAGHERRLRRARTAIVGGHTISDSEPKAGLAVVGSVDPARVWSHRSAREGQALVLTKALGHRASSARPSAPARRPRPSSPRPTAQMMALNDRACEVGLAVGRHLGHRRDRLRPARAPHEHPRGVRPRRRARRLSPCPCSRACSRSPKPARSPAGASATLRMRWRSPTSRRDVGEAMQLSLGDAQTSGGLAALRARGAGGGSGHAARTTRGANTHG